MIPRPAALIAVALLALAPAAAAAFDIVPFAELCGATIDHPTAVPRTEQQVNPAGGGASSPSATGPRSSSPARPFPYTATCGSCS